MISLEKCGRFGQIKLLPKTLKVAQIPINRPIWSHWLCVKMLEVESLIKEVAIWVTFFAAFPLRIPTFNVYYKTNSSKEKERESEWVTKSRSAKCKKSLRPFASPFKLLRWLSLRPKTCFKSKKKTRPSLESFVGDLLLVAWYMQKIFKNNQGRYKSNSPSLPIWIVGTLNMKVAYSYLFDYRVQSGQIEMICWHLITPSSTLDFLSKVGLNPSLNPGSFLLQE